MTCTAPHAALGGLDATIIECLGQSSRRQAGKLAKDRPQCLGAVERLGMQLAALVTQSADHDTPAFWQRRSAQWAAP